ncbi:bacterial sugar transferase [Oceanicola granulosus HTCC2516]|uniref:Bacterial sugar transferase n=1 Tax=Oceanicola granulosus (strain ATCC BAA-861 / DSM 15982 / KCTC 12143 / HTCC2516) TaxID=314256 RepID=Q2CDJ8_OCEGH|nr:sugar transferase [Oceanicola granulosus]EAR50713.1 bacterial sugar transferase [Oceanicola granulosus HTCC2516]
MFSPSVILRPALTLRRGFFYRVAGKRLLDIAACLALAPFVLPIIALAWLAARLQGGPAFFAQERVGQGGATFRCYKLRTMVPDAEARLARLCARDPRLAAEWRTYQKLRDDPRVTPLGRLLRRTSLDELPQLWNVLRGDMSLVGPRPFTIEQESLYRAAGGSHYYSLRPGLTGPWQVSARGKTTFAERVRFDRAYSAALSPRTDLRLLLRTVRVVLRANGH